MMKKFCFLGYGNCKPMPTMATHEQAMSGEYYYYPSTALTVGRVYEALDIIQPLTYGFSPDILLIDDNGEQMNAELKFFIETQ